MATRNNNHFGDDDSGSEEDLLADKTSTKFDTSSSLGGSSKPGTIRMTVVEQFVQQARGKNSTATGTPPTCGWGMLTKLPQEAVTIRKEKLGYIDEEINAAEIYLVKPDEKDRAAKRQIRLVC